MNSLVLWIGGVIVALVVAAALTEAYLKRNKKRRLSDMRPDPNTLKRRPWEPDGVTKVNDIEKIHAKNQNWNRETGGLAADGKNPPLAGGTSKETRYERR